MFRNILAGFFLFVLFVPDVISQSIDLTLEDIWHRYTYNPKDVYGINFLNDGEHFSTLQSGSIVKFNLKTGKFVDTLFSGRQLVPSGATYPVVFSTYQFSDDESKILLATEVEAIYRRSTIANYFVWDRNGEKLIQVSGKGRQMYATFSPSGDKVAFVRDNNIFITNLSNGKETQVTTDGQTNKVINGAADWVYEEEFSLTKAFFWSPESDKIAYIKFDESRVREYSMPVYGGLYPEPYVFKYPKAGEKNSVVSVHLYDLKSKKTIKAEIGENPEQYIPRMKWTQDNNVLCIERMNRHQNQLDLLLADATNGKAKKIFTEEDKAYIDIHDNLVFLKDGKHFIWTSGQDGFNHIYLYDLKGNLVRQITNGNWEVTDFYGIDEQKNTIYFQSAEVSPIERHVYSVKTDGSKKVQLSKEKGTHGAVFSSKFTYYINRYSDVKTPLEITLCNSKGKEVRVLEDNMLLQARLSQLKLSNKEFFSFKTSDNVELNGYLIKPHNFDPGKQYPLLMFVYGGPGSQTVTKEWGGSYDMWFQHLASKGYIIASVDNRGTGGRGEAFKKVTYLQLGKYETIDQVAAAKYLGNRDYVDASRIGIFGWSYGGYMSSLCITKGADIFKTAIAIAPVTHWKFYDTIYTERYMRTPQENREGYEENAPLNFADKLKGNYLIVHGTGDDNVHFQNTVEMTDALITHNKQFDMAFYPNKNHGIYGGNTRLQLFTKITDFILEKL